MGVWEGKATITATTVDGGFTATCDVLVPKPTPKPTEPIYLSDKYEVARLTGIDPNDLEERNNKVYLKKSAAEAIARALLGVNSSIVVNTSIIPIFRGIVTPVGRVAAISFEIIGRDLFVLYPYEINLIGMISGNSGRFFKYVDKTSEYDDMRFTLRFGGTVFTGEISPNETYELVVFIKDGGIFDLDGRENSEVISSIFIASEGTEEVIRKGEGGGCNVGYLSLALLAVLLIFRRRIGARKNRD
jgi:hypothetical protein